MAYENFSEGNVCRLAKLFGNLNAIIWYHDWRKVYALCVVCEMKKLKFIINIMAWKFKTK